jgi:mannose-1-phosphate guanylyltransferase
MKAFLLAGGRGTRLHPVTLSRPKCLVPIDGVPLLAIWLDLLERNGVTDVLLNVSHHVEQVESFLRDRASGPQVRLVVESMPVGNAGTVASNRAFVADADDFWILYADNLTSVQMAPMIHAHGRHTGLLTMGLFNALDPSAAGIVSMGDDGRVLAFEEKPKHPRSPLANAGIYLARHALLDSIPTGRPVVDFGLDVFPSLLGRFYGHVIDDFLMDVGTPAALQRAQEFWRARERSAVIA